MIPLTLIRLPTVPCRHHASANPEIKQQYLNDHFCYAYKTGIMTNVLGIIRAIDLYVEDYSPHSQKSSSIKK